MDRAAGVTSRILKRVLEEITPSLISITVASSPSSPPQRLSSASPFIFVDKDNVFVEDRDSGPIIEQERFSFRISTEFSWHAVKPLSVIFQRKTNLKYLKKRRILLNVVNQKNELFQVYFFTTGREKMFQIRGGPRPKNCPVLVKN